MRIIKPEAHIMGAVDGPAVLRHIELCGRTCYKSENKITAESAEKFVRGIIRSGHEAVLEHYNVSVRFVVDRGVSHEIVRHRIASYCQESTRYCNYGRGDFGTEITVIQPYFMHPGMKDFQIWEKACSIAEDAYFDLLDYGCTAQEARDVLPNSLKTELVMTTNLREWRHFFKLRALGTTGAPHPQMREVATPLLREFAATIPVVFDDLIERLDNHEH